MRHALIVLLALAGCIESSLILCGELLCPAGHVCVLAANACFPSARVDACSNLAEESACTTAELPVGICRSGVCMPPSCGDGVVQGGEQCDGLVTTESCLDRGFYAPGALVCTEDCRIDASGCGGGYCGDQIVNGPEVCDGSPPVGASCYSFGYDRGALGCSSICGVSTATCGRIGWHEQPISGGTSQLLLDVVEIDGEGLAVGLGGVFRRVGTTWIHQDVPALPADTALSGIWGAKADDVFAVGANGTMLHFDGTAWSLLPALTTEGLTAIRGVDATSIHVVGAAGTALRYDGSSWQVTPTGVSANLNKIAVVSRDDVYAVGSGGTIVHWDGTSWTTMPSSVSGTSITLNGVVAIDASTVYAVGSSGTLLRFDGTSWQVIAVPFGPANLRGVLRTQAGLLVFGVGAIFGDMRLLVHYDGERFVRLDFVGDGLFWSGTTTAAGDHLLAAGLTLGAMFENAGPSWARSFPGAQTSIADVSMLAIDEIYGVGAYLSGTGGHQNQVLRFDGFGWTVVHDTGGVVATAILARAPDDIFIGVDTNAIHHWNGIAWEIMTTPRFRITGLSAAPGTQVYASSFDGILLLDGATWVDALAGRTDHDIHVFASGQVVAVGGDAAHFDGTTWTTRALPGTSTYRAVWGAAADDIYAVGDGGALAHFDGTTWSAVALGVPENLTGIAGTAANDIWLTSSFGAIFHYDGTAWTPVRARFEPTGAPVFTRLDATPSAVAFGARNGRIDVLVRH